MQAIGGALSWIEGGSRRRALCRLPLPLPLPLLPPSFSALRTQSMEESSLPPNPRTVEEVFKDFLGRRSGVLKALTSG